MSLFDYSSRAGVQQDTRPARTLYPSLSSDRKTGPSKLFDLSMDDFDDIDSMSDLDNMNFDRIPGSSRGVESQPMPQTAGSKAGGNSGFQLPPSPNQESGAKSRRPGRSLSFDEQSYLIPPIASSIIDNPESSPALRDGQQTSRYGRSGHLTSAPLEGASLSTTAHKSASMLDVTQSGPDPAKYATPAAYRAHQTASLDASSATATKVKFSMDSTVSSSFATPAAHSQPKTYRHHETPGEASTSSKAADASFAATATKMGGGLRGSLAAETPAYKLPPHPAQGSTVTARWKRRGRLGLAKPKRNDTSQPSDDSVNGTDGDSSGMGLGSSPPGPLDFAGSSSGAADARLFDTRLARSPPSSPLPAFGTTNAGGSQRHSYVSMDDAVADAEHTFNASLPRHANKSPSVRSNNSHEASVPRGSASTNVSFDGTSNNRSVDASDVSMNSNPRSRAQSPDVENTNLPKDSESLEPVANDPPRWRGMSPAMPRPRSLVHTPKAQAGSAENLHQRNEHVEPSKQSRHSPGYGFAHGSPRQQGQGMRRSGSLSGPQPSGSSSQGKRTPGYSDTGNETATRFQQYERRMNDSSPQYRSPRDRQRALSNLVPGGDVNAPQDAVYKSDENSRPRLDQFASADPRPLPQRLQSGSSSARVHDKHPSYQRDERPEPHSAGYNSPKSASRRAAPDNNFDTLRNMSTITIAPEGYTQKGSNGDIEMRSSKYPDSSAAPAPAPSSAGAKSKMLSSQPPSPPHISPISQPVQQQAQRHHLSPLEQQQQQIPVVQQTDARPSPQPSLQPAPEPQQQQQQQQAATSQAGRNGLDPKRTLVVNGRVYQKISITGRGGSSKVYKAMSAKHEIFAIKRVSFSRADPQAIEGYVNEILLLRKFEGNPHIIQLFDAEINKERGLLHMVMEFGETDLANVLKRHGDRPLGMNMIRVYWEQMLRAVQTIHEERVVHADLKPANYLLVRGSLKLIDFGIAKAIGNDTTNIHRENQIGTVNYMSPEAIKETNAENGKRMMKLGRASDIWSLGIILYQMCYGRTPFAQLALFKKLASIPDPTFQIPYPRYMAGCLQIGTENDPNADASAAMADGLEKVAVPPDLLRVMKVCLQRDPAKRMTIPDLLTDPLLCPISLEHALPSAMSQMLSLLKCNPQVLDQWDVSDSQNEKVLASLVHALHQQEQSK